MTPPSPDRLFTALDVTWAPASLRDIGPWRLREGRGGGQRVSAATAISPVTETDIAAAETEMRALGQHPLFMIRDCDTALDSWLDTRGYAIVDPVTLYLAPTDAMADMPSDVYVIPSWPPLAAQRHLWAAGGIGPARIDVMARASDPKTALLARHGDAPAGVAFLAVDDDIAMLHALEVTPNCRRHGIGRALMIEAARWATRHDARWLTLAVTKANAAANALYRRLGMDAVTFYHYRKAPA